MLSVVLSSLSLSLCNPLGLPLGLPLDLPRDSSIVVVRETRNRGPRGRQGVTTACRAANTRYMSPPGAQVRGRATTRWAVLPLFDAPLHITTRRLSFTARDRDSPPTQATQMTATLLTPHLADHISAEGIPAIRDRLLALAATGRKVCRLESGDPSFDIPSHVAEAIVDAIRSGKTHYSQGGGIPELREAIAEKVRRENRLPITSPKQIQVANGATNALFVTLASLLNPGDEVIVQDPNWTNTQDMIALCHAKAVGVPLTAANNYTLDPKEIEARVTDKTRLIIINTPHNPTGSMATEATLAAILDIANRHNLMVLSDEAYEHVVFDGRKHVSIGSLPGAGDRVVSVYSMSKSYAMSGLRVGYLATTNTVLLDRVGKLLRSTINHVSTATQYGAVVALTRPQDETEAMRVEYEARRNLLLEGIKGAPVLHVFKPEGAFFLWARIDPSWEGYEGKTGGRAMTNFLIDKIGVGSAPGESFGLHGANCVRFSFSCARDHIERAAEGLRTLF